MKSDEDPNRLIANLVPYASSDVQFLFFLKISKPEILDPGGPVFPR